MTTVDRLVTALADRSLIVQDLARASRPAIVVSNLDDVIQSRWSSDGTRTRFRRASEP